MVDIKWKREIRFALVLGFVLGCFFGLFVGAAMYEHFQ